MGLGHTDWKANTVQPPTDSIGIAKNRYEIIVGEKSTIMVAGYQFVTEKMENPKPRSVLCGVVPRFFPTRRIWTTATAHRKDKHVAIAGESGLKL